MADKTERTLEDHKKQLDRIELKLDLLIEHAGLTDKVNEALEAKKAARDASAPLIRRGR